MTFLPEAIWRRRLGSELRQMRESGERFSSNADATEYEIEIAGRGLYKDGGAVKERGSHRVGVKLMRSYPYAGGIEVTWLTPIFHPNIRAADGRVCIQLLNNWGATSSLVLLAGGLRQLLEHPNPLDPLDYEAAEYYSHGVPLKLPPASGPDNMPRIIG